MTTAHYFRTLVVACQDTVSSPTIRGARSLERFHARTRHLFSAKEREWIGACLSMSGWDSVAECILQERRFIRGEKANPKRFSLQPSMVGMGVHALMLPSAFMRKSFHDNKWNKPRVLV